MKRMGAFSCHTIEHCVSYETIKSPNEFVIVLQYFYTQWNFVYMVTYKTSKYINGCCIKWGVQNQQTKSDNQVNLDLNPELGDTSTFGRGNSA